MNLIVIEGSISELIVLFVLMTFTVYLIAVTYSIHVRREVNEILGEVFDASMTQEEKGYLGPVLTVPPLLCLMGLGIVFILMNIASMLIPLGILLCVCLWSAVTRKREIDKMAVLQELADTEL